LIGGGPVNAAVIWERKRTHMAKGRVKNHSSRELWVVETDTGTAIAHRLPAGKQTPSNVDADGFRAVDGTRIDGHTSWVKINDYSTADVRDSAGALERGCILCRNVADNEFGSINFDNASGWGESLT